MNKFMNQVFLEANADIAENTNDMLTHDICKAVGLFSTFGYRCKYRSYDNYDEAIYLSRLCRKIAKKHNGDIHYAYESFLKMYADMVYEKNIIRNEEKPMNSKYQKLDYYRWYNCTGLYAN